MGNGHPRFMAWVNSPPHPVAWRRHCWPAALNSSVRAGGTPPVRIEHAVVRWFLDLLGWTPRIRGGDAQGLFVSGGSLAAAGPPRGTAPTKAPAGTSRDECGAPREPVVFATAEARSCLAVELLASGRRASNASLRRAACQPRDLARRIAAATAMEQLPVAVVASVSVNTGAMDPPPPRSPIL